KVYKLVESIYISLHSEMALFAILSMLTNARGMLGAPATWFSLNVMIIALALSLKAQILCPLARLNTKHLPKLSSLSMTLIQKLVGILLVIEIGRATSELQSRFDLVC